MNGLIPSLCYTSLVLYLTGLVLSRLLPDFYCTRLLTLYLTRHLSSSPPVLADSHPRGRSQWLSLLRHPAAAQALKHQHHGQGWQVQDGRGEHLEQHHTDMKSRNSCTQNRNEKTCKLFRWNGLFRIIPLPTFQICQSLLLGENLW